MRLPSVGFTRRSRSNQSRAPLAFRRNRLNLRRAQRNVVGHRRLDDSFSDFKTGPAISPISWFDAKQPRPREWGGEAHESNEMECCRRAGDRSFSLRLSVRDSAPSGPGHRGDLPDTFGQLSYLKLTSSKFHLLLPRIGDRHSGRHLGTLSGVGSPHNRLASRLGRCYFSSVPSGLRVVSRPSPEHPAMTRMRRLRPFSIAQLTQAYYLT